MHRVVHLDQRRRQVPHLFFEVLDHEARARDERVGLLADLEDVGVLGDRPVVDRVARLDLPGHGLLPPEPLPDLVRIAVGCVVLWVGDPEVLRNRAGKGQRCFGAGGHLEVLTIPGHPTPTERRRSPVDAGRRSHLVAPDRAEGTRGARQILAERTIVRQALNRREPRKPGPAAAGPRESRAFTGSAG